MDTMSCLNAIRCRWPRRKKDSPSNISFHKGWMIREIPDSWCLIIVMLRKMKCEVKAGNFLI